MKSFSTKYLKLELTYKLLLSKYFPIISGGVYKKTPTQVLHRRI